MKESVDISALFEEWLTISRSHLFFILAHISFRLSLILKLQIQILTLIRNRRGLTS